MTSIKLPELRALFSSLLLILALSMPAAAQQESSEEELAKKTQNPVADLISVPLQNNFNFGAGFNHNKMIYILNVQPVIPIHLNDEWNLITRTIMPIINQPSLFPTAGGAVHSTTGTGLGRHQSDSFSIAGQVGRIDLGPRSDNDAADRHRSRSRQRSMEHGASGRCADHARPLGLWRANE